MLIDRRGFLRHGLVFGSVLALPRLSWADGAKKEPGARTLVMLHLNGGNDGLNTVIPYTDPLYRVLRPGLGVADGQVRKIDPKLGLHPALGGLEDLWRRERLAIVNGVGYPRPNYSHFRATEIYYTAQPERTPTTGWVGRALEAKESTRPVRAVSLTKEKPLSLAGPSTGVVTLTDFGQFRVPGNAKEVREMYRGYLELGGERAAVARRALEALRVAEKISSLRPRGRGMYGGLGRDLQKAVALLGSDLDLEIIHLSFGGFDTHASQARRHNGLLAQVGNNLRAFQLEIERAGLGDRVTTFVFSEFGRRAGENLSGGTDHGAAYPAFLIGKGVKPGLHGAYPALDDLDRGNLKYTTDFRAVYATLLAGFLSVDPRPVLGDHEPMELFL